MARLQEITQLTRMRVVLFLREPEAVFWTLVFPLVLAVILGWAFQDRGLAPERVGLFVGDLPEGMVAATDQQRSRWRQALDEAPLLKLEEIEDWDNAQRRLSFGHIGVLVLPSEIPVLRFDPQRSEAELARLRVEQALFLPPETRNVFQAEEVKETGTRYIDWLFPGLLGMNLMGTGIWGIGFALADTRQKKLLRRLLVTPMRKTSFLLSFLLSRMVFLVFEVVFLALFAIFVLGVPLRGSVLTFGLLCLLGTATFAALGILIASRARTIEGVSGLMNLCMMPMWLFSGVFFSYERFPDATHAVLQWLPLTALNDALRAVMLDGSSLAAVLPQMGVQSLWLVVTFVLALRIFRWE